MASKQDAHSRVRTLFQSQARERHLGEEGGVWQQKGVEACHGTPGQLGEYPVLGTLAAVLGRMGGQRDRRWQGFSVFSLEDNVAGPTLAPHWCSAGLPARSKTKPLGTGTEEGSNQEEGTEKDQTQGG